MSRNRSCNRCRGCHSPNLNCRSLAPCDDSCDTRKSPYYVRVCDTAQPDTFDTIGEDGPIERVTTNDVDLFVEDIGDGPVVVFVPPAFSSFNAWSYQVNYMATHGFRAISFDPRGHGQSSKPLGPYGYDVWADDLAVLLDKLDVDNVVLVGASRGGAIALHYVAKYGCCRVRKLVLAAATAPILVQTPTNPFGVPAAIFEAQKAALAEDTPAEYAQLNANLFWTPQSPQQLLAVNLDALQTPIWGAVADINAFEFGDLTADMAKVCVPTLIIQGAHDAVVPFPIAQNLHAGIAGSIFDVFPNSGHASFIDQKDLFNTTLAAFAST